MAATPGPSDRPVKTVIDELLASPKRFLFYQAVSLLEKHARGSAAAGGGAVVGDRTPARAETLRLRALDSLGFPTSEVEDIETVPNPWDAARQRYLLTANFLGVYGPASPLPGFYTERIIQTQEIGDDEGRERLRAFLDIFNHRLLSFYYRCLYKYRYHLTFQSSGDDVFSYYMRCLIGRGTKSMPDRGDDGSDLVVSSIRMTRYAGLLTQQPKSAAGLRGILADFFRPIRVRIGQCVGRWMNVEDRNQLGVKFCTLGEDLIVGSQMYDRTGKFRVSLGPLNLHDYVDFLPPRRQMAQLKELVMLYLLDQLSYEVELRLRGPEVPPIQLGSETQPAWLGWTSWLKTQPAEEKTVILGVRAA